MAGSLDLNRAQVALCSTDPRVEKAAQMLVDEVAKRTRIRWPIAASAAPDASPIIALGLEPDIAAFRAGLGQGGSSSPSPESGPAGSPAPGGEIGPDGYRIETRGDGPAPALVVAGKDPRGALFGVGRLLRELRMARDTVSLPGPFNLISTPRYPLRGHQLGYRPKTNSYDAWSLPVWEQYIRDLAVFGANAVELIPPRSDDDPDSPHFPLPPIDMMEGMSRLLDDYGLDVWIWYPAMDADYTDPGTVDAALAEWGEVFRRLPRIDAVFVPGGDPGHTPPRVLMDLLARQTEVLRRHHPSAGMWVSPQGFDQRWLDEFLQILRDESPEWLAGVVYGPQVRGSLAALRAAVADRYPIRSYPDITHTRQCQYPVPDWDPAFAFTEGREPINPRPLDQARLFRLTGDDAVGLITYSEGCNDDVNKAVWSGLGWDPDADVVEILRQYGRYFIGDRRADGFAQGLLALERSWRGSLLANAEVYTTLAQFRAMERDATPQEIANWRFQQALYRAYYDAFIRSRLIHEMELEDGAMDRLRDVRRIGSLLAINEAEAILDRAAAGPPSPDWRARVFELAEALFQSIGMQLSVERYAAIAVERGANLDSIDVPLNNGPWLKARFADLRALSDEAERVKGIGEILDWTNPGPGGFYDDLGHPGRAPHLERGPGFEGDPAALETPRSGFAYPSNGRISWRCHAETLYDIPLRMRYDHLDSRANYRIRVVYGGDSPRTRIRLAAGNDLEIHPFIEKPRPIRPIEFDLPPEATASGALDLCWRREPGLGGNGRGCQVSEVWLMKRSS